MVEVLRAHGLARGVESINKLAGERLRLCVNSSLQQLPADDRLALAILTMFPTNFDISAAKAVLQTSRVDGIQRLTRLQLKSWVKVIDEGSVDSADEQYQLHLLIKNLASNDYERHSEFVGAQQAFIKHYLAMLRAAEPEYTEAGITAVQQLRLQRLNLTQAFLYLALQEAPMALQDLKQHCHLGLSALRALTRLRIDAHTVVQAMCNLLIWAEAAADSEAILDAREQLGYVRALVPEYWQEAEHELTTSLVARQNMHGANDPSSAVALAGLAALMSAKAQDGIGADAAEQQAANFTQQLYQMLCSTKGEADPEAVMCAIDVAKHTPSAVDRLKWLDQSLVTAEEGLGGQHPVVLLLKYEQIKLKARSDYSDVKDSILELRQSLESCTEQRGSQDSLTVNALICLGRALVRSPQVEEQQEGVQHLREAVKAMAATYSSEDKEVLGAQLDHLVPSLIWLQQADDATQLLCKLQPVFLQQFEANSLIMVNLLRQHAAACYAKDDYPKGESFLRQAISRAKAMMQASSVAQQTSFVVKQGLYLELASNLEEQGR